MYNINRLMMILMRLYGIMLANDGRVAIGDYNCKYPDTNPSRGAGRLSLSLVPPGNNAQTMNGRPNQQIYE